MVAYAKAFPQYTDPRIQRIEGANLLKQVHISTRVSDLVEAQGEAYNFTFEEHLMELRNIRDGAIGANQFRTALEAELARGKLVGFHTMSEVPKEGDKHLHLHTENNGPVTDDARVSAIVQMFRKKIGQANE